MNNELTIPYITSIHIDGLFGHISLDWNLKRGVNVLSGINGSGKSSVIQAVSQLLKYGCYKENRLKPLGHIAIYFEGGGSLSSESDCSDIVHKNVDVVSTFDSSLKTSEAVQELTGNKVRSDLDWDLYMIESRYLKYQLALGKKAIELLMGGGASETLSSVMRRKDLFLDTVDSFFKGSGKTMIRNGEDILFANEKGDILTPYQLSSGEKQLVIILTTVLCQNNEPYILLMDEPEISLHFEWQKKLIGAVMQLNPNLQLILTTHSPAVVMEGWLDRVQDIGELVTLK